MKVYLNAKGQYLHLSEASSHSPVQVYYAHWGLLDAATLFPLTHQIKDIKWKDNTPHGIITHLPANEFRTVTLLPPLER